MNCSLQVNYFCNKVSKILVGTKKDLRYTIEGKDKDLVSYEAGKKVGEKIDACAYIECSAIMRDGVQEVFETAVRAALKPKRRNPCRTCTVI